ncbi:beta-glucosidase 12-like [Cucumis melo]|uniref:Beta-glucosidase 12-like n=1 Tax=Cucumis melo TaxID=3656 RepID=A0A1S3BPX7_CUCME|nr:beta-glucosidase 12-like [Cucumis melo]
MCRRGENLMGLKGYLVVNLAFILVVVSGNNNYGVESNLNRNSFPQGFVFGSASSAYQYEGAANKDGRRPSIWDTFTHKYPGKIQDGSNGDEANDAYHRYKEDVGIMKDMNFDAYRFSISWSRILPNGKLSGGVNQKGIEYYNNLIDELVAKGIKPFITLFHWDLPQALEDKYGGFLSPHIVNDFEDYAELCFKTFGDRVKQWITLNEPWTYSMGGYAQGSFAPNRCSAWQNLNCSGGNAATEPYIASHYQILAHAAAVKLYRDKYQKSQKGLIGITLVSHWFVPVSNVRKERNAAYRALDFMFGWFMDPLTFGEYPKSMQSLVRKRLPTFTKEQSELVKGSFDFLGFNYYTANYASYTPPPNSNRVTYFSDARAALSTERNGIPIGPKAASPWLAVYPRGIHDVLLYIKEKYNNPLIYITENGVDEFNNASLPLKEALVDNFRIDYYKAHLSFLKKAIEDGVRVKGYFAWSLLDNFEWSNGYTVRFGINFVDYKDEFKRYPKSSAHWFKKFLKH